MGRSYTLEEFLMRARSALLIFAACSLAAPILLVPGAASAGPEITLRYHFTAHQQSAYLLALHLRGTIPVLAPRLDLAEQVPFSQRVTAVYADGSGQVSYGFTRTTTIMNGQTTTSALAASSVARISPTGAVTIVKSLGLANQFGGVLNVDPTLGLPHLPISAVVVGSHWTAPQRFLLGSLGALQGMLHYTLVGVSQGKNGHTIATIDAAGSLPLNLASGSTQTTGKAGGTETISFDATAGAVLALTATLKINANLSGTPATSQPSQQAQTATLNLELQLNRR
jgi:hypothetical protein